MKWWPLALALAAPAVASELPPPSHEPGFVEGVALGLYFRDDGRSYVSYFWEMAQAGANTVTLVISWHQSDVTATTLVPEPTTPSDEEVRRAIQSARSLGLDVALLPIVRLETRGDGEWRGVIEPSDTSAWFESYTEFISHYAAIASDEEVSLFSVGSELGSMEQHEGEWREVIATVRREFDGRVTYSANWDHYHRTPFWDALDVAGTTGYHELADNAEANPSVEQLVERWAPIVDELAAFSANAGRDVLITEVGYVSQTGAAHHPWDYTTTGAVDLAAQRDLYEALFLAMNGHEWLAGVTLWTWFGDGGSSDDGYTPRGKPAEQVLRHWFRATVPEAS